LNTNYKPKIAVSIGDINGISPHIALHCHEQLQKDFDIVYTANKFAFNQASTKLKKTNILDIINVGTDFNLEPSCVTKESGLASFEAFVKACDLADTKEVDAIITLPIHKKAWDLAGAHYAGHTEYLRDRYKQESIMALGCDKMFVGLYTDHIKLKDVFAKIKSKPIEKFLLNFYKEIKADKIAVLGLNPHAGDGGVLGMEDFKIADAIKSANAKLGKEVFDGPFPPDTAYTLKMRKKYKFFAAMTHDHGLSVLKALYFDKSINVSLGLSIIRASVDHGVAFDIAYKKNPSFVSYFEAFKYVKNKILY
jgi:4-hydroxythreonine-4-phosphate dehydrogenase